MQVQKVLLKQAWDDGGEVYGYRKLHDDLCDLGEDISPNRAWRLARLAGIRAQIGYKKKPGSYGGSPAVVADNTLNREFDVDAPDQFWGEPLKAPLVQAQWRGLSSRAFSTCSNARASAAESTKPAKKRAKTCSTT